MPNFVKSLTKSLDTAHNVIFGIFIYDFQNIMEIFKKERNVTNYVYVFVTRFDETQEFFGWLNFKFQDTCLEYFWKRYFQNRKTILKKSKCRKRQILFWSICQNFLTLLLCKINILEIVNMFDFFNWFFWLNQIFFANVRAINLWITEELISNSLSTTFSFFSIHFLPDLVKSLTKFPGTWHNMNF